MREIKFRAWNKEQKKIFFDVQNAYDYQDEIPATTFGFILKSKEWEVMQFTGLKDKNGKDIYEGDILIDNLSGENFFVFWFEDRWGISSKRLLKMHDGHPIDESLTDFLRFNKSGIIGNKFENPELLKEKK